MTYDMIIVGAGPAGLNAALYGARYGLNLVVIGEKIGGTAIEAAKVENWIGSPGLSGMKLMEQFEKHVRDYGVEIFKKRVVELEKKGTLFSVKVSDGETYEAKSLILALGLKRRKLNVEGAEKFEGKGISYCFTCDAPLYRDAVVGVVGGNDSAAQAALLLSNYAKKIYVIYRKEPMRCTPALLEKIENDEKIELLYNANLSKMEGKDVLERVELDTGKTLELDGLFIEIGAVPTGVLVRTLGVKTDDRGHIEIDKNCSTNVEGVYAAGDVTDWPFKQIVTAAAQGATACFSGYKFLKSQRM